MTSTAQPSPLRQLLTLALPIVISRASQTVIGLSDALLVADLGKTALSATTTGALNVMVLLILPMGVTFIVSSYAAQHFGRGELGAARRYGWYGLIVSLFAQALGLLGLLPLHWVLDVMPMEADVRGLMEEYMRIRLLTGGAAIGVEALANYYGGLGRTRPGMVANLVAMALNVVLDWALIWGKLGAPALGVAGAAWASALATLVAFLGFFAFFLWDGRELDRPRLALHELLRMLRFGLPSGFNWLFEFLAYVVFVNVVVGKLGTATLAALNSVMQLNSASFMPSFGLSSAGAILVGQAIGAKKKDDVPALVWLTVRAAASWQGAIGLFYFFIPAVLMRPFTDGPGGAEMLEVGTRVLMVSAAWQLFDATAMAYAETLRAAGDTLFPMLVRIVIAWFVFLPGAAYSVYGLGLSEVAASFWLVAYLGLLAVAMVLRFRSGKWRSMELVEGAH